MRRALTSLALLLLVTGGVAPFEAAAQDPTMARLRRIGRAEWPRPRPSPGALPYAAQIRAAALRHGLPADLLAALVRVESAFNRRAVSHKGARGLGQLMPGTWRSLGVRDPFDPEQNLDASARYLAAQLQHFGDTPRALAAYNAGPRRAAGPRHRWPAETRDYVRRVMSTQRAYALRNLP